MNALTRSQGAESEALEEAALAALLKSIRRNRFLPIPPQERNFVGDGDFLAIGCEFLRHFVELGGLRPQHRVLEIGCGIGRMALPLTQYLEAPTGTYDGFDVVAEGIDWCRENISGIYPDFRFQHLDFNNELYNPAGALAETGNLPFADKSADFIFMTSVVTHLDPAFTDFYFREAARILCPGGRLFLTAFVLDGSNRRLVEAKKARPAFHLEGDGPAYIADRAHPMAAVAYDNDWLLATAREQGLQLARPIAFGHWSGRSAENYQDICVFQHGKPALSRRNPA
ncbi:class I SAM-dependent methyltransferase [Dongia sp.]|uniref:class I SAM-dependent methyltransferase n=1 Tax=Dongia sp. TaxID=1977262 RepID=UPI0035ADCB6F